LNVASGALSAFMPPTQRNLLEQAPQIMSGSNYGVPQKIASSVGETIPAMLAGGGSLPGQAMLVRHGCDVSAFWAAA